MTVPQDVQERLVAWLTSHGFTVDHVSADGTSVYATSTVSNIAEQLQVEMARVTRDGITYNAARTAPSLPDDVGDGVRAIIGLQPFRQANKQSRRVLGVAAPAVDNQPPYVVSEVLATYGADGVGVTGAGQTSRPDRHRALDGRSQGVLEAQRPGRQALPSDADQRGRRDIAACRG